MTIVDKEVVSTKAIDTQRLKYWKHPVELFKFSLPLQQVCWKNLPVELAGPQHESSLHFVLLEGSFFWPLVSEK